MVAVVALVVATWQLWMLMFTALIIAAAILPAAKLGARYRVPRGVTVLAVYVVVAGVFTLMGRLMTPALTEQWRQFIEQLPKLVDNVKSRLGDLQYFFDRWGSALPASPADNVQGLAGVLLGNALRVTTGAVGALFELLAILVIAAYSSSTRGRSVTRS